MKPLSLELEVFQVRHVCFGEKTSFKEGVLTICKDKLIAAVQSEDLVNYRVDLALPGDSVRILPVKDVIEPRMKTASEKFFPGVLAPVYSEKLGSWGDGKTTVLRGCTVITTGQIVFYQEGLIDMSGPGAEYSIFSRNCNVVVCADKVPSLSQTEHEKAVRLMGLKAAVYLARAAAGCTPDAVETYSLTKVSPDLPRIGLVYLVLAQGLLHDNYIYGKNPQQFHTMFLSPNEFMDGALVSGNCVTACDKNTTYDHMNHPVIRELYQRHGKDLNFVGVITSPISPILSDKERCAHAIVNMARTLNLDGVIVVEEGGGNPETDLMMICGRAEKAGIKTVLMLHENCGSNGASQGLTIVSEAADAIVSAGNVNEIVHLPRMERVIGCEEAAVQLSGAPENALHEDGTLDASVAMIIDAASNIGVSNLGVVEY